MGGSLCSNPCHTKLFLANPELPEKAADTFRLNPSEVNTIRGFLAKALVGRSESR